MADPAPKTQHWSARENVHEYKNKPKGLHIIVHGQVEVNNTNLEPHLAESAERNPKNLGLDLTIKKTDAKGADVTVWKAAHFHKEVKANEFDNVNVRWHVDRIAEFPVIDDREHDKHSSATMATVNAASKNLKAPAPSAQLVAKRAAAAKAAAERAAAVKAAKAAAAKYPAPKATKPKKAAAKKSAAKKAAKKVAKKTAAKKKPKAVGGWAKSAQKALKKLVRKVTKKAPKKAAKKAAKKAKKKGKR